MSPNPIPALRRKPTRHKPLKDYLVLVETLRGRWDRPEAELFLARAQDWADAQSKVRASIANVVGMVNKTIE